MSSDDLEVAAVKAVRTLAGSLSAEWYCPVTVTVGCNGVSVPLWQVQAADVAGFGESLTDAALEWRRRSAERASAVGRVAAEAAKLSKADRVALARELLGEPPF